tara:strand:+ start:194630 stop:195001 length:372 start_codon:yes stop_codon:yes gene_type:complete
MAKKKKLYCVSCTKRTEHREKMDASKEGKSVCDECDCMNAKCTLIKTESTKFKRGSDDVLWVEFDENGKFSKQHKTPAVGRSLLMSPFNMFFTWQTTLITEVIEESKGYVKFQTENTLYELYY